MARRYTDFMNLKLVLRTFLMAGVGVSFALTAGAQWQWIDKDGRKVFSDRSPPAEIKEQDIVKRPKVVPAASSAMAPSDAEVANPLGVAAAVSLPKASMPKILGKDAQLEARKKQIEDEQAALKKADDEKTAKARSENCERARRGVATMESGVRLSTTSSKGEREIMDDKTRAVEIRRLQDIVISDCK